MSAIKFSVSLTPSKKPTATVVGVLSSGKDIATIPDVGLSQKTLEGLGVKSKRDSISRIVGSDGGILVLAGLGAEQPTTHELREIGGAIGRLCCDLSSIDVLLPTTDADGLLALLEGIALGAYEYPREGKTKIALKSVHAASAHKVTKADLAGIAVVAEATHAVRNLSVTPANLLYPEIFAKKAVAEADANGLKVQVWDEKALAKDGFGAILGVGQGSIRPPRLVKLVYAPKGARKHLAIVGKGITFDTGGLAVKPLPGMLGMKYDMTGAAVAFQSVLAIAKLGLPIKVTAWLCLAENMVSGSAVKPGDVVRAKNGKTIEVTNPDAEGRLVMADGLSAASLEKPDLIVDVATLTGAARVALGIRYSALMGTDVGVAALQNAAEKSGELVWHMPLPAELRANLDSPVADLANMRVGATAGGALVAALFLKEFIGLNSKGQGLEWAHLDIAGPADNEGSAYGFTPKGPTGVMLRTLVALAGQMSAH
jgi:leucyl aminopeptidase